MDDEFVVDDGDGDCDRINNLYLKIGPYFSDSN